MSADTKVISVRLPTSLHRKLVDAAEDDHRSLNSEIVTRLAADSRPKKVRVVDFEVEICTMEGDVDGTRDAVLCVTGFPTEETARIVANALAQMLLKSAATSH